MQKVAEEANEKLRIEHGNEATTAEELLEDILSGGSLEADDPVGIDYAVSRLEDRYFLAVETGRDADFNRKSFFRVIIMTLFPHLKSKWASELAEAQTNGRSLYSFEDFLKFLTIQKYVAYEMQKF